VFKEKHRISRGFEIISTTTLVEHFDEVRRYNNGHKQIIFVVEDSRIEFWKTLYKRYVIRRGMEPQQICYLNFNNSNSIPYNIFKQRGTKCRRNCEHCRGDYLCHIPDQHSQHRMIKIHWKICQHMACQEKFDVPKCQESSSNLSTSSFMLDAYNKWDIARRHRDTHYQLSPYKKESQEWFLKFTYSGYGNICNWCGRNFNNEQGCISHMQTCEGYLFPIFYNEYFRCPDCHKRIVSENHRRQLLGSKVKLSCFKEDIHAKTLKMRQDELKDEMSQLESVRCRYDDLSSTP
jgi:hypothetical protein